MPDRILKYFLIFPALICVMGATIYPLVYALITSFRDWRLKKSPVPQGFVGLENYIYAFEEPEFWNALKVTSLFVSFDVLITVLLSLTLALVLRKAGVLHSLTRAVLILPFAMSPALIGVSFRFMFNGEIGLFAKTAGFLIPALKDVAWLSHPQLSMVALIFSDVWHWFPYMTLIILGGIAAMSTETEEAARIDGASEWQVLIYITLPQLASVIGIVALLKTIFALKMFDQVVTLTGGGPGITTQTLAHYVYSVGFVHYDMGLASALAYILTFVLLILATFYLRKILPAEVKNA